MKNKILLLVVLLTAYSHLNASVGNGSSIFKKCSACHGAKAEKKALGSSRVIAGWDAEKVSKALHGYRAGTYGGPMKGIMKGQVASMSNSDIAAVAVYIENIGKHSNECKKKIVSGDSESLKMKILHIIHNGSEGHNYPMGTMPGDTVSGDDAKKIATWLVEGMQCEKPAAFATCAICHGDNGTGMNGQAPDLKKYIADFYKMDLIKKQTKNKKNEKKSYDLVSGRLSEDFLVNGTVIDVGEYLKIDKNQKKIVFPTEYRGYKVSKMPKLYKFDNNVTISVKTFGDEKVKTNEFDAATKNTIVSIKYNGKSDIPFTKKYDMKNGLDIYSFSIKLKNSDRQRSLIFYTNDNSEIKKTFVMKNDKVRFLDTTKNADF